jgi:hypothetical protein
MNTELTKAIDSIKRKVATEKRQHYTGICIQLENITKNIEIYDEIVEYIRSTYKNVRYYKEHNFKNINGCYVGYLLAFDF